MPTRSPIRVPFPTPTDWDLKHLERYDGSVRLRALVELAVVRKAIEVLTAAGYSITVDDGEDRPVKRSVVPNDIMDAAFAVDECHLIVHAPGSEGGQQFGSIRLVFGNDGWDVIADNSVNLEEALAPVTEYAEHLCEDWH